MQLANQRFNDDRSTMSSLESGSVRQSVQSTRPSRVPSEDLDDRSVGGESMGSRKSVKQKKKSKKLNKARERNDLVM